MEPQMLKSLQYKTLILICIGMLGFTGCKSDTQKLIEHSKEVASDTKRATDLMERSANMIQLCTAARHELRTMRDMDPKIAAKHRAFLEKVIALGRGYGESLYPEDPHLISAHPGATFDQIVELDYRYVIDQGYEAAKLGAGDEDLAKSMKESLMVRVKALQKQYEAEKQAEVERKKARENWK